MSEDEIEMKAHLELSPPPGLNSSHLKISCPMAAINTIKGNRMPNRKKEYP
jgi:hypothetical protein